MIKDKEQIWKILVKYDTILSDFCDSLSNILQEKSQKSDFFNIIKNYQNIDNTDVLILNDVIGSEIMLAIND
jgi:hypothetical protein